jgi:predicted O-linked N-acetylglucosamine transferase (SPINDLY family)
VSPILQDCVHLALQHHQAGRLPEAEAAYREVLRIDPENIDALHFLGVIAYQQRRHEQARQLISQALARNTTNAPAHNNLGNVLVELGSPEAAVASYRQAIALQPDYLDAHINLANLLQDQGRLGEAIASYRRALALDPELPEAHSNLGNALRAVGEPEEAAACCRAALALKPGFTAALCNLGNALKDQDRLQEAIACYREALALQPDFAEVHYNLGNALANAGRMHEALECFRKALSINPEYAEARWAFAMSQLPAVYEVDADPKRCRDAFSRELEELERWFDFDRASVGFKAVGVQQPFYLAYQEQSNRALLARHGNLCARIMAQWSHRQGFAAFGERRADKVIRVGIVSPHFRNHSVWNAIVKGWFQKLDRSRFAIDAFHLGSDHDEETLFARSEASHFEQGVGGLRQWVEAIATRRPDVLIYPEIGMDPMTVRLASMRLAPVQIATWGHPETSGLPTMDYYLSAENLEPPNAQEHYTERLVSLPHLGCYYQPAAFVAADPDLAGLGIDPTVPILLCPGLPHKYAPQHDRLFTEIARGLGRCQFVFFTYPSGDTSAKLRRRLEIVFARSKLHFGDSAKFVPWQSRTGFYGFLKRSEVFLDTIGFSGFNTAMQALECGLPVVTREGRFLRGRLASGILKRIGLPELVAKSEEEYVGLAIKFCRDAEYRERVRKRIEAGRHVLFEDAAPIRAMEEFLAEAVKR